MEIVDFGIAIWVRNIYGKCHILIWVIQGAVVVFGAWSSWTYDYNEYSEDMDNKNYCAYNPMMAAFLILLFEWVNMAFSLPLA